jgi:hypothetical protein
MKNLMIVKRRQTIWYGDVELIEECAKICGLRSDHPKKVIRSVMNQLEKSPDFVKCYITADFEGAKRKYRCFKLRIETKV